MSKKRIVDMTEEELDKFCIKQQRLNQTSNDCGDCPCMTNDGICVFEFIIEREIEVE